MTRKPKRLKMLGSIFRGAWGRGKVTLVTVVVALSLALISPALAATGGNFILGKANTATDPAGTPTGITQLTAQIANPAMKLINTSTLTGATALNLQTAATKPPMTVNSKTKVDNLNADTLDGINSTGFYYSSTVIRSFSTFVTGTANGTDSYAIPCLPGDMVLSGGYEVDPTAGVPQIYEEHTAFAIFEPNDNGYVLKWKNGATPAKLKLYAHCADFGTPFESATASANASAPTASSKYKGAETESVSLEAKE
jgi:hypothetical protein